MADTPSTPAHLPRPAGVTVPQIALREQDPNPRSDTSSKSPADAALPTTTPAAEVQLTPEKDTPLGSLNSRYRQPVAGASRRASMAVKSDAQFVSGTTPVTREAMLPPPEEATPLATPEKVPASFHDGGFGKPNASIGRVRPNEDARRRLQASAEFKVVLVGSSNAGKTCLAHRYVRKWYSEVGIPTVGAAYNMVYETFGTHRDLEDDDGLGTAPQPSGRANSRATADNATSQKKVTVKIGLWDTAGQEQFAELVPLYFRDAKAVILVADCTRRDALPDLKRWLLKIGQSAPPDVIRYLVLSKIDATFDRFVSFEEACAFAESADLVSGGAVHAAARTATVASSRHSAAGTITPDRRLNASMSTVVGGGQSRSAPPMRVMEVSSKTGEGVIELFHCVAEDCWNAYVDATLAERAVNARPAGKALRPGTSSGKKGKKDGKDCPC